MSYNKRFVDSNNNLVRKEKEKQDNPIWTFCWLTYRELSPDPIFTIDLLTEDFSFTFSEANRQAPCAATIFHFKIREP
jgi:hypothetical protein